MSFRPILLAAASVLALAACSGEPFVDWPRQGGGSNVTKMPKVSPANGHVEVCYSDSDPPGRLLAMAGAECEPYKMKAVALSTKRNDCTLLVPNKAYFQCFDPEMRLSNGQYVNPWVEGEVKQWWEERQAEKQGRKLDKPIPLRGEGPFGRLRADLRQANQGPFQQWSGTPQPADAALGGVSGSPAGK